MKSTANVINGSGMMFTTRRLTVMSMFTAISIVLVYFIHFPIFPITPFLQYDPADIPIFIVTFAYGPMMGLIITAVVSVIQGVTVSAASGIIGIIMHILATGSFVVVAGNIYKKWNTRKGQITSIALGTVTWTATMVVWNIVFTPLFLGQAVEQVLPLLIPAIIPFNIIKAGVNGVLAFMLYKGFSKIIDSRK